VLKDLQEDMDAETISWLTQNKEEIMGELQDLELQLEDEREWQGKFLAAAQSCAPEPISGPRAPRRNSL
jgi:hypothetical protein